MAIAAGKESYKVGWKVCCGDSYLQFDRSTSCMVLRCPHGEQHLGIKPTDAIAEGVLSGKLVEKGAAQTGASGEGRDAKF